MVYRVTKKDIARAGRVLADAFLQVPFWNRICEEIPDVSRRLPALYEVSVRQGVSYGGVMAPSENLEGVIAWVPGEFADLNFRQLLRCGALPAMVKAGLKTSRRLSPIFARPAAFRRDYLAAHRCLYLLILGVPPANQGKGYGRVLLDAVIEDAERQKLPVLVGAGSEDNVALYERFGFKVIEKLPLAAIDLYEWEMVREPRGR